MFSQTIELVGMTAPFLLTSDCRASSISVIIPNRIEIVQIAVNVYDNSRIDAAGLGQSSNKKRVPLSCFLAGRLGHGFVSCSG